LFFPIGDPTAFFYLTEEQWQNGDELPGIVAARQLVLFSLDSMGWAVAFRLGGASIVSTVESHLPLLKGAVARRR
jgi:hypothetical protein